MKISAWTIKQGDWTRSSDSDYDKEIQGMRREKRKVQMQASIAFLMLALAGMVYMLYLIEKV